MQSSCLPKLQASTITYYCLGRRNAATPLGRETRLIIYACRCFMYFDSIRGSLVALVIAAAAGCGTTAGPTLPVKNAANAGPPTIPSDEEIKRQVDDALNFTFTRR